mgnify:FL=1
MMMTRLYYEAFSAPHEAAPAASLARRLLGRVAAWHRRRAECHALLRMDDHLLRDIGLDRLRMMDMVTRPRCRD